MARKRALKDDIVSIMAIEGMILNTKCYRGFAPLKDLAAISCNDPLRITESGQVGGMQRRLEPPRARKAYKYAKESMGLKERHLWPEVILNIRERKGISISRKGVAKYGQGFVKIKIEKSKLSFGDDDKVSISRVDGNHRLHYSDGKVKRYEALDVQCPFCITVGLSEEEELRIFTTINENQKGVQSSTRQTAKAELLEEKDLYDSSPVEWFTEKLIKDPKNPFHNLVDLGVEKKRGEFFPIKRTSVAAAHRRMIKVCAQHLTNRKDLSKEQQYTIVNNYWQAIKDTWNKEWGETRFKRQERQFFLWTASPGIYSLGTLGGYLINLLSGEMDFSKESFLEYTKQISSTYPRLWHMVVNGKRNEDASMGGEKGADEFFNKMKEVVDTFDYKKRRKNLVLYK